MGGAGEVPGGVPLARRPAQPSLNQTKSPIGAADVHQQEIIVSTPREPASSSARPRSPCSKCRRCNPPFFHVSGPYCPDPVAALSNTVGR